MLSAEQTNIEHAFALSVETVLLEGALDSLTPWTDEIINQYGSSKIEEVANALYSKLVESDTDPQVALAACWHVCRHIYHSVLAPYLDGQIKDLSKN